ncbi:right-handed parallel beta-helix repeat-containing protein [Lachnoclostridium sp. Marseille-P6806]|uniref:right-handed parallel beta-helix repeat-containing protein n=1 Tax=Lachnoclostridium sp. Marseille-P6806 TaxID=2364793 RepID=UPI001031BCD4|nr:right-handed parallel beta-helix repeat-containing protein [Lachnoclostridium sp. Marseille-P6806]
MMKRKFAGQRSGWKNGIRLAAFAMAAAFWLTACGEDKTVGEPAGASAAEERQQNDGEEAALAETEGILPTLAVPDSELAGSAWRTSLNMDWMEAAEIFLFADGSFYYRMLERDYSGALWHYRTDAEQCFWRKNGDVLELEFVYSRPNKKETYYARLSGDKLYCPDFMGYQTDDLTFVRQASMPEFPEMERDCRKLIGDWSLVRMRSGYYYYMADDDIAMEGTLRIYEDGNELRADYRRLVDGESYNVLGSRLTLREEPAGECCLNEFWSAELQLPEEEGERKIKLSLLGDNELEMIDEVDYEEDYYEEPVRYLFLRAESAEYENREDYRYVQTVTVSDVHELVRNMSRDNTRVILKAGTYNLSDVTRAREEEYEEYGEILPEELRNTGLVSYQDNLLLETEEGAEVTIVTENSYDNVLFFDHCGNIVLRGLTLGHEVEPGRCSGNVVMAENSSSIRIEDCRLYGSGAYGVALWDSFDVAVENTDIYDCTYGIAELYEASDIHFKDCRLYDSREYSMFDFLRSRDILAEDCEITGNTVSENSGCAFINAEESDGVLFRGCVFEGNRYEERTKGEVVFEDCTFRDNVQGE